MRDHRGLDTPTRPLKTTSSPRSSRASLHAPSGPAPAQEHQRDLRVLLVIGIALIASVAGITNEFAHDDLHLIINNARVQGLQLVEQFTSPFWPPPFSQDLYRPLTTLLLSLQYAVGGEDPLLFRIVSYTLYAACAALTYTFGRRFVDRRAALATAALFAAHPVHVEAVALAAAQNELLVGMFAMIIVGRYLDARARGSVSVVEWTRLTALFAAAALLKETGLVLPALIIAAELCLAPGETRSWRQLVMGMVAMAVVAAGVLLARAAVVGDIAGTFVAEALLGLDAPRRALTMLGVVPEWIRLLVWPAHLRLDYSPQEFTASSGFGMREALGAALLLAAVVTAALARRRAPLVTFGLAWTGIALLPVSNVLIPTGVLLAERTLFLPSIGLTLAVAGGLHWAARHPGVRTPGRVLASACAVLVALGVARSMERQRVWRNDAFLSVRTVQDAPRSFRAQRAYADVLFALQRPQLALEAYARAIDLAPDAVGWRVRNDLARQLRARGEHRSEVGQLEASLRQQPGQLDARGYLVAALLALGEYERAAEQADSAVAHGGGAQVFSDLRRLADSARQAGAPPGSVRIGINVGAMRGPRR